MTTSNLGPMTAKHILAQITASSGQVTYRLPTDYLHVDRPFQHVSIDLVGYKTESASPPIVLKCPYALTIIDYFTRFSALVALPNKKEQAIAKVFVERVFGIYLDHPRHSIPIKARSSKIKVVEQLQDVFGLQEN